MKYTFKLLNRHTINGHKLDPNKNDSYWQLEIKTLPELLDYYEKIYTNKIGKTALNYINSREVTGNISSDHLTTEGWAMKLFTENSFNSGKVKISEIVQNYNSKILNSMIDTLEKAKALYFNENGGYWPLYKDENLEDTRYILDIRILDDIVFPLKDSKELLNYRLIRWPLGKHWYVKIGDLDVEVNGFRKWNTKEEAEKAGKYYLRILKRGDK